ncbi:hypothetical protein [Candidatus Nitronereus thalassa]|uniref:Uncharacterized protein n=1 Tax=Candidatus Nitronereus thalassa TaxID=3020898 RepID=A0ABU3K7A1_9BACT|nr:hypothetical protein [Candidatus Nitronereus thalassa]MDT7042258.1 hypothetical protein [Candidatus Nitronereus thalassa]
MHSHRQFRLLAVFLFLSLFVLAGCGRSKVYIGTGTLLGIEASPGDPNLAQAPNVSFGYRRVETALVPIKSKSESTPEFSGGSSQEDAYSVLAFFGLEHHILGKTKIDQLLATGHAARQIQNDQDFIMELQNSTALSEGQ